MRARRCAVWVEGESGDAIEASELDCFEEAETSGACLQLGDCRLGQPETGGGLRLRTAGRRSRSGKQPAYIGGSPPA